jgi:hypothetical protein
VQSLARRDVVGDRRVRLESREALVPVDDVAEVMADVVGDQPERRGRVCNRHRCDTGSGAGGRWLGSLRRSGGRGQAAQHRHCGGSEQADQGTQAADGIIGRRSLG